MQETFRYMYVLNNL